MNKVVRRILSTIFPQDPKTIRYLKKKVRRQDGLFINVDTRNLILWEECFGGGYEPHVAQIIRKVLRPGDAALDIGANHGVHTLTMAKAVGSSGLVVAVEPNPRVFEDMCENIKINDLDQVRAIRAAAGSEKGSAFLRVPSEKSAEASNTGLASIHALETPHTLAETQVIKIDDRKLWNETQRLRLVKVDVQGYEEKVIKGMLETLDRTNSCLIFEYEDWAWKQSGANWPAVLDMLKGQKFRTCTIKGNEMVEMSREELMKPPAHMEIIATKEFEAI